MANLTEYTGNAGLGLGSTPGAAAPLGPNDNLKVIQDAGRDIMLLDAERNTKLFQQKINDRDNLTKLILNNQVSAGEIDPKYHKEYDDAKADVEKAYDEWGGNPNDTKGYRAYQEKVTHLQDVATHAQVNTLELKKLIQQRAEQTLPWKQKELDQHIEEQKNKDFWDHVDPYQQMFGGSVDDINKLLHTTTTSTMSPNGLWKYDLTKSDFAGTLKNAQNEYLNNGKTAEDMRWLLGSIENYDPKLKEKAIASLNGQLKKYNDEMGLKPGDPGYVDDVELVKDESNPNVSHIRAAPADFAAKWALAQQEKFSVTGNPQFMDKVGTYDIDLEKNRIAWAKLAIDKTKAWAYADRWATQKKLLQADEQVGAQKYNDLNEAVNPIDGRINTDQLPESRQFIGGIVYDPAGKQTLGRLYPKMSFYKAGKPVAQSVDGIDFDTYGKEVKAKTTKLPYPDWVKQKALEKGYTVEGHYDTKYFDSAGTEVKSPQDLPTDLQKAYSKAVTDYGMSFGQFLKGLSKLGKVATQFQGANGTATPQTILEGSRLEQSKAGKKGFEGVYEPGAGSDEEPPSPPEQ
jgi:hypothetical protein